MRQTNIINTSTSGNLPRFIAEYAERDIFGLSNVWGRKTNMKKSIISVLVCVILVSCLACCGKSDVEDAKKDLEQTQEKYGWVEKETVDVLVAKFNTEVVDNSTLNPASTDYLTENDNQYWYGLIDGVYLVVVPEKNTSDKTTEIVKYMLLYIDKNSEYKSDAISYIRYLIKANNNQITDSEIDTLLEEAKAKSDSGKTANNGKGISIGYLEKDEAYQYEVIRLYK